MYLEHFGIREFPFSITPDTSYFFSSDSSQEALNTLLIAARTGEGFITITGEVGTGKTLLCRKLMASLGPDFQVAYIPNPYLEPLALFAWLAGEPHPSGVLAYAWKTLIENHPHDSICGCSIDEVHDENDTRFARVLQVADGQRKRSLRALARRVEPAPAGSVRFLVVNTDVHPFAGRVDVTMDLPVESVEPGRILDSGLFDAPLAFFPRGASIVGITDPEGRAVAFEEVRRERT